MIQASNAAGLIGVFQDEEDLFDFLTNTPEGAKVSIQALGWTPYHLADNELSALIESTRIQSAAQGRFKKGAQNFSPLSAKALRKQIIEQQRNKTAADIAKADAEKQAEAEAQAQREFIQSGGKADAYAGMTAREKARAKAQEAAQEAGGDTEVEVEEIVASAQNAPTDSDATPQTDDPIAVLMSRIADANGDPKALKKIATSTPKKVLVEAAGEDTDTKKNRLQLVKELAE